MQTGASAHEQPPPRSVRSHIGMDNAVNLPSPSEPDSDFWKGFLLGTVAGMVIAAYSYVMTDFNFAKPMRRFVTAKPIAQKPAA